MRYGVATSPLRSASDRRPGRRQVRRRTCQGPAHNRLLVHPQGPFDTFEAAREYGRGMAMHVYGSEHSVTVESREVGEWRMHGGIPAKVGVQ